MNRGTATAASVYWGDKIRKDVSLEKVSKFKSNLARLILEQEDLILFGGIGCDYKPDFFLEKALHDAGIEVPGALPFKTHMIFRGDEIYVKEGYRAPFVRLDRLCERRS